MSNCFFSLTVSLPPTLHSAKLSVPSLGEKTLSLRCASSGVAVLSVVLKSLTATRIVSDDVVVMMLPIIVTVVALGQLKRHSIVVVAAVARLGEPVPIIRFTQVVLSLALERVVRCRRTLFRGTHHSKTIAALGRHTP